jgi:hypothetical protein
VNTIPTDYQQQLLMALRLRKVPGRRIAEALAEVDSHVAETGEDAYQAFGEPKAYADQIAGALGSTDQLSWRSILTSMTWQDGVTFLAFLAGSGLVFTGLFDLGAGRFRWLSLVAVVAGAALLAATVVWIIRRVRTDADRVLDPRTGRNMAPPLPRWTVVFWIFYPAVLLFLAYLTGMDGG